MDVDGAHAPAPGRRSGRSRTPRRASKRRASGTGTIDDLDAYVEADGTPVRISFSFTAEQLADDGSTASTLGTSEIRFSDVGGDQVIAPPSLGPTIAP